MLHKVTVVLFLVLLAGASQGARDWGGSTPAPVPYRSPGVPVRTTPFVAWNGLDLPLPAGDILLEAGCVDDALDEMGAIHLRWRAEEVVDGNVFVRLLIQPSEDFVVRGRQTGDWLPVGDPSENLAFITRWGVRESLSLDWPLRNAAEERVLRWTVRLQVSLAPEGLQASHQIDVCHTANDS